MNSQQRPIEFPDNSAPHHEALIELQKKALFDEIMRLDAAEEVANLFQISDVKERLSAVETAYSNLDRGLALTPSDLKIIKEICAANENSHT